MKLKVEEGRMRELEGQLLCAFLFLVFCIISILHLKLTSFFFIWNLKRITGSIIRVCCKIWWEWVQILLEKCARFAMWPCFFFIFSSNFAQNNFLLFSPPKFQDLDQFIARNIFPHFSFVLEFHSIDWN
jgi:hypothetical protein